MKLNQPSLILALSLAATSVFAGTVSSSKDPGPSPLPPQPAPSVLDGYVEVGFDSTYFYRGLFKANSVIEASAGITIPLGQRIDLSFGAWDGHSFTRNNFDELRLSADLDYKFSQYLDAGVGYIWYNEGDVNNRPGFGNGNRDTYDSNEVNAHVTGHFGIVDVTALYARNFGSDADFAGVHGGQSNYVEVNAKAKIAINNTFSLVPSAVVGYGENREFPSRFATIDRGVYFVGLRLDAPIRLTDHASLVPYIAVNLPTDDINRRGNYDASLFGGAALKVKF